MSTAPGINRVYWQPMSQKEWEVFYGVHGQTGHGMTYFRGRQYQRGSGFGSIFKGLFNAIAPIAKTALRSVGKQAVRTGLSVASDALAGADPLQSLEYHGRHAAGKVLKKTTGQLFNAAKKGAKQKKKKSQTGRGVGVMPLVDFPTRGKAINKTVARKRIKTEDFLNF